MATDQPPPPPTVLLVVDPDGWLHEVPRCIFTYWCQEQCIDRSDNLLRACTNREKTGWHFSNETGDKRGSWQPLHKLVFLQKVDKQLNHTLMSNLLSHRRPGQVLVGHWQRHGRCGAHRG